MIAKFNLVLLIIFILLALFLFLIIYFFVKPRSIEIVSLSSSTERSFPEREIIIFLVGDIMLDRGVKEMVKKYGQGDFKFPFSKVANVLREGDVVFGNLEGPISDKGRNIGSIYSFRFDPKSIEGLKFAGFNVLSLANNHIFDYAREALLDTLENLKKSGIDYVGGGRNKEEAENVLIKEIKTSLSTTRIGFLAYTNVGAKNWRASENRPGINFVSEDDLEKIKEDIKKAKQKVDILIVSLHAGDEYSPNPNKFQINFSKIAIDAGADLVVGHHPHVIQKLETYKDRYIFYSLGNFVFDQNFSEETLKGLIVKIVIQQKKIKEITPLEIKINRYFQPEIISI